MVTARIVRDQLHFNWRTDFMKVTNDTVLVPITIQVPNSQLSFQVQGRHALRDAEYFWARQHADRPRGADVRRSRQPRFSGFPLPAIAEAAVDLSEGRSAAPGPVPAWTW